MKFKIGDRVQIKKGSGIKGYTGGWNFGMEPYVGRICQVLDTDVRCGKPCYHLRGGDGYIWDERSLIAVSDAITIERSEEVKPTLKKGDIVKVIKDDDWIPKDTIGRVEEVNSEKILVKYTNKYGHDASWWISPDKCELVLKA